jgi:hypothetical protein
MAAPFDTPFDANDDTSLSQKYATDCRRRSLRMLLCIITFFSCAILANRIIPTGFINQFLGFLIIGLLIASICYAVGTIISGTIWLIGYRSKQTALSAISGWLLGLSWLLLIAYSFFVPAIGHHNISKQMRQLNVELADAKQIGLTLFVYANENNGNYPSDLNAFANTNDPVVPKEIKRLLYQKNGKQLRWALTPGLTTNDPSNTILLQSTEKFKEGSREALIVYTVGNSVEVIKNPDQDIIIINGKPTLRQK